MIVAVGVVLTSVRRAARRLAALAIVLYVGAGTLASATKHAAYQIVPPLGSLDALVQSAAGRMLIAAVLIAAAAVMLRATR